MKIFEALRFDDIDSDIVLIEARRRITRHVSLPVRHAFLQRLFTLGGLSLLTGCSISDNEQVEAALSHISRFNDKVQGLILDPNQPTPTHPGPMIAHPSPFNVYYGEGEVYQVGGQAWRLEVTGSASDRCQWNLADLYTMRQYDQVIHHICVEDWSAIGKWGGVHFDSSLHQAGADLSARYVGFECADDYHTSIDMATALHPQTLMVMTYDGAPSPPKYGFPMRLRIPIKLGYRNPRHIQAISVTNIYSDGY